MGNSRIEGIRSRESIARFDNIFGNGHATTASYSRLISRVMQGVSATGLGLASGTASLSHTAASDLQENGSILPFTSNTDTLIPAQGRSFMKFSYDFPEPCIAFEGLQFGFRVFTFENVYAMDSG